MIFSFIQFLILVVEVPVEEVKEEVEEEAEVEEVRTELFL